MRHKGGIEVDSLCSGLLYYANLTEQRCGILTLGQLAFMVIRPIFPVVVQGFQVLKQGCIYMFVNVWRAAYINAVTRHPSSHVLLQVHPSFLPASYGTSFKTEGLRWAPRSWLQQFQLDDGQEREDGAAVHYCQPHVSQSMVRLSRNLSSLAKFANAWRWVELYSHAHARIDCFGQVVSMEGQARDLRRVENLIALCTVFVHAYVHRFNTCPMHKQCTSNVDGVLSRSQACRSRSGRK